MKPSKGKQFSFSSYESMEATDSYDALLFQICDFYHQIGNKIHNLWKESRRKIPNNCLTK